MTKADTIFKENIFFAPQESEIRLNKSTNNIFDGNYYLGNFIGKPADKSAKDASAYYYSCISKDPMGFDSLSFLFDTVIVGDGAAVLKVVSKDAIHRFFEDMKN